MGGITIYRQKQKKRLTTNKPAEPLNKPIEKLDTPQ
jgi:hypothetical protein